MKKQNWNNIRLKSEGRTFTGPNRHWKTVLNPRHKKNGPERF